MPLSFDVNKLLDKIYFPNDKYEIRIRKDRAYRLKAIRKLIEIAPEDTYGPSVDIELVNPDANLVNEKILLRQLSKSAAILTIQAFWRGVLTRQKYFEVVSNEISEITLSTKSVVEEEKSIILGTLPDVEDLSVQEKLIIKYRNYCRFFENTHDLKHELVPDYPFFCAAYIQSYYRMFRVRRAFFVFRNNFDWKAAKIFFSELKRIGGNSTLVDDINKATCKIQKQWRAYTNKKIYKRYRNLINFRQQGDPRKLLKFVNPQEASYIDSASGVHVRFRLGGIHFPPTLLYKIYTHSAMIDINAFAPRDYTTEASKMRLPKHRFNKCGSDVSDNSDQVVSDHDGWYQRFENNGWRIVSERFFFETEQQLSGWQGLFVSPNYQEKTIKHHHVKLKRIAEIEQKKRTKKLNWLRELYSLGKADGKESIRELENELVIEDELLNWSKDLDFDLYANDWLTLATSGASNVEASHHIEIESYLPEQRDTFKLSTLSENLPELPRTNHSRHNTTDSEDDEMSIYKVYSKPSVETIRKNEESQHRQWSATTDSSF